MTALEEYYAQSVHRNKHWNEDADRKLSLARDAINELLAEVERLRAEFEEMTKLHDEQFKAKNAAEAEVERLEKKSTGWMTTALAEKTLREQAEAELAALQENSRNWGTLMIEVMGERDELKAELAALKAMLRIAWTQRVEPGQQVNYEPWLADLRNRWEAREEA